MVNFTKPSVGKYYNYFSQCVIYMQTLLAQTHYFIKQALDARTQVTGFARCRKAPGSLFYMIHVLPPIYSRTTVLVEIQHEPAMH